MIKDNKVRTPEEEAELNDRLSNFNNELRSLLGKYNLAIGAVPFLRPDGGISAKAQVVEVPKDVQEPEQLAKAE